MQLNRLQSISLLATTAVIWGVGTALQSAAMEHVEPLTFNCLRLLLAMFCLLPFCLWNSFHHSLHQADGRRRIRISLLGGLFCGLIFAVGSTLQMFGLVRSTAAKTGFITTLYVVFVPLLSIFIGKKVGRSIAVAVLLAIAGFYFMCFEHNLPAWNGDPLAWLLAWCGGLQLGVGDLLLLCGAVAFALHIMIVGHFSPQSDVLLLNAVRFLVAGLICGLGMLLTEEIRWQRILDVLPELLYVGAFASSVGYSLQTLGQRGVSFSVAALVLSMEAVTAALAGWFLLGQTMSGREICGAAIVSFAVIIVILTPEKSRRRRLAKMSPSCYNDQSKTNEVS